MHQFMLQQGRSAELRLFPHLLEVGIKKNASIQLHTFPVTIREGLRIYYIIDGKFDWCIHQQTHTFYPGDVAVVMPGMAFGNEKGMLEIGSFTWIHLDMQKPENGDLLPGKWSGLSGNESAAIGKILSLSASPVLARFNEAGKILKSIHAELFGQEIGYQARVNHQLDELLIQLTRHLTRQNHTSRDFPK
ncbi:MAG: AraC family transcriptional regulator, partial [Bacteroidetes bacterium]|nr:AraC family transcriptional regulator [Bacteroidota bacterium]